MDAVDYSQDAYNKVKGEVEQLLKGVGYEVSKIPIIPASAYYGDNLVKKSEKMVSADALDDWFVLCLDFGVGLPAPPVLDDYWLLQDPDQCHVRPAGILAIDAHHRKLAETPVREEPDLALALE